MELLCQSQDGTHATTIQAGPDATFGYLKQVLSVTFKANPDNLQLVYKGNSSIPDSATLKSQGVTDHDMLMVVVRGNAPPQRQNMPANPGLATLEGLLPPEMRGLDFARLFGPPQPNRQKEKAAAIRENFETAMRENPESFAPVYMLYIDVEVNGVPIKAFVDSGAQTTIMSKACALNCKIIDLVDPRFAGVAQGVGSARILGKVHLAPLKIGNTFYNASFSVLDQVQNVDLLIGLDLLKRYHCNIDLRNDVLHIGSTQQTVPFLSEAELPNHAKLK